MSDTARWLYLVVSAAPPVLRIEEFIRALQADGWSVALIATPNAANWLDLQALEDRTSVIVRVHPRSPYERASLPRADAVVAAPMTFNSINKWAAGFSDNQALGILNELLEAAVPILAVPCAKASLRAHPAYLGSVARLAHEGVVIMDPDAVTVRAEDGLASFDWKQIIDAARAL